MEDEYSQTSISKYNDAVFSIKRLHNHWIMAERYATSGRLIAWKFRLDCIWRELFPDVKRIVKNDSKNGESILNSNTNVKKIISEAKTNVALYNALNKRHELLRELQDMSGKGGVYVPEDEETSE